MPMNAIEQHVLEMIGESVENPDVFKDTDTGIEPIRDSINDAIEEITMLTGSHKVIYRMPLIANQGLYRLRLSKGSIGWITDAWLVNQKYRLTQTDEIRLARANPRWLVDTGNPRDYFQIGKDVIGLSPKPGSTSGLLELTMVVIPERYSTGDDRIFLRDSFKWGAVHFAVSEFWASRGDARSALDHHGKYLQHLGLQELYPKSAERTPYFRTDRK